MAEASEAVDDRPAGTQRWGRRLQRALFVCLPLSLVLALAGTSGEVTAQDAAPRRAALPADGSGGSSISRAPFEVEPLLNYFEAIALEAEYRSPKEKPVIVKWQGPLRIGLNGTVSRLNRRTVERHVRTLADLTGLDMQVLPPMRGGGNVSIHFLTRKDMDNLVIDNVEPGVLRRLGVSGGCYFVTFQNPPDRIIRSAIVVNIERDQQSIHHCLLEELTQSLGLPNDSDMMRPSIFSHWSQLSALAPQDAILLRTLYDPRMLPGMNRDEARTQARAIISELVRPEAAVAR